MAGYKASRSLADRGSAPVVTPTQCNAEPTIDVASDAPTPTCYHAASPQGGMGLCPEVGAEGWCDCGSDGNYPNLDGSNVCGYTSLPTSTLVLSSTNCGSPTPTTFPQFTYDPITTSSTTTSREKRSLPTYTGIPERRRASRLSKRQGTVTFSNCDDEPSQKWVDAGFNSKRDVLQKAYDDARTLAKAAQDVSDDNKGFTHYFGGEGPDAQLDHFTKMMKAIASDTNYYSITFECKNTPSCFKQDGTLRDSSMVTDASAQKGDESKTIEVCPKFFTRAETAYLLYDSEHSEPSPPYRSKDSNSKGWCGKRAEKGDSNVSARNANHFATAGHTILHELTHLDSLAKQAGLQADAEGKHGTLDVQRGCELLGARDFLKDYINGKTDETSPDYAAESYAAAATEIYFMNLCSFSQIRPVT